MEMQSECCMMFVLRKNPGSKKKTHCATTTAYLVFFSLNSQLHRGPGARAPELWCPLIFWGDFLMVYSNLCWQCSDKTRKCQEHINTIRKKEKLTFLMPILEITIKKPVVNLKGHQSSGARAPELWCPHNFFGVFLVVYAYFLLAVF